MNPFSKLFYPFIDPLGRPSDKPNSQESGITDNPMLFMGEAAILLSELSLLSNQMKETISLYLNACRVQPGVYHRHPDYFRSEYNIQFHNMSHDENNGIAMIAVAAPELKTHLIDMVQYLDYFHWQYTDQYPGADFFRALKNAPIITIKKLKAYIGDYRLHPENTIAVDLRHDPDISSLSNIRQPRDIAFYKLCAGKKASLFSILWLCISTILCTRSTIIDGSRGGTMLMAWFRNLTLQKLPLKGLDKLLIHMAIKVFHKRLVSKYGTRYPEVLINAYFDRIGPNNVRHPMIQLVSKYVDTFMK